MLLEDLNFILFILFFFSKYLHFTCILFLFALKAGGLGVRTETNQGYNTEKKMLDVIFDCQTPQFL